MVSSEEASISAPTAGLAFVPQKFHVLAPAYFAFCERPRQRLVRRLCDIVIVVLALPIVVPVLLGAAVAIRLEDGGSIIFRQRRVGRFGRLFTIFKLRTMRSDSLGDALKPRSGSDARITRVGAILRKLSIDELPQLLNILLGDMTLIGPRPEMPFVVRGYERWQILRLLITPGLTCLWQSTCRSTISLERPEATVLDLAYIRDKSILLDVRILANTVTSIVRAKGAH